MVSRPVEVADQAARLAAGQLGDVGVLLLRHDARPGGVRVVERDEGELLGRPEDDLLGEPRDVDRGHRRDERELGGEVPAGGAVDGVLHRAGEAEVGAPPPRGRAPARTRRALPSRTARAPCGRPSPQPVDVPQQRPRRGPAGGGPAAPAGRAAGGCARASPRRGAGPPGRRARRRRPGRARTTWRACSRRYIRNSVAIWSLRERPARSRPPTSAPTRSMRPRSSAVCTSSSPSAGRNAPAATSSPSRSRPSSIAASVASSSSPAACSTRAWARDPAMSCGASRQSKWVDLDRAARASAGPPANRPPHRLTPGRAGRSLRRHRPCRRSRPDGDLAGQAPQLDEALGLALVEGVALVVGRQVEVVEAAGRSGGR